MAKFRIPVEENFSWQQPVISVLSDPPGSPAKGDRYLVGAAATGAWAGHEDAIAWFDTAWQFDAPSEGWRVYIVSADNDYNFDGADWVSMGGHVQNTDQALDLGGANEVTAVQAKEAYTRRGQYDAALKCITMDIV